jgi:competence protein CoiA
VEQFLSFSTRDERESRESFYPKMVWVVDGQRRARDRAQFFASLRAGRVVNREPLIVSDPSKEGALLRDWGASRAPVYFDFGDSEPLWRLNPCGPSGVAYLSSVVRTEFLRAHLEGVPFEEMFTEVVERHSARQAPRSRPLAGFERYMARRQRRGPRF